jgi:hypothetical protein
MVGSVAPAVVRWAFRILLKNRAFLSRYKDVHSHDCSRHGQADANILNFIHGATTSREVSQGRRMEKEKRMPLAPHAVQSQIKTWKLAGLG